MPFDNPAVKQRNGTIEGKIFATFAYLSVLCVIPLIAKKHNKFVVFHTKQGLVIFIGEVIAFLLGMIVFRKI